MSQEEQQQKALIAETRRLAHKYAVISDRDHPLIIVYAAAELLGLALEQIRSDLPDAHAPTVAWLKDGIDKIEVAA